MNISINRVSLKILTSDFTISKISKSDFSTCNLDINDGVISLVFEKDWISLVHQSAKVIPHAFSTESEWIAFCIDGVLEFSLAGLLNSILSPLARADIGVLVYSSYDTDYIFVKMNNVELAVKELVNSGFYVFFEAIQHV